MTIAHDAVSESHTGTTGAASVASFTWNHVPAGTPRGALVYVFTNADAALVSSVTYGGVTMTAVPGGEAIDTAGEPCRCKAFFLGASIPTGTQAVVVNRTNDATVMYAVCVTQTAAKDTEVVGPVVLLQGDQALVEQAINTGVTNAQRYAGCFSGLAAPPTVGANSTNLASIDFGALGCSVVRETTPGSGLRPVGFAAGLDDVAAVHVAIAEIVRFDDIRQDIINGLDSGQAEGTGWDAIVKATLPVTAVVRTSNTVVTITLPAEASYDITATETITGTIPAVALVGAAAIVATPTITIDESAGGALALGVGGYSWTGVSANLATQINLAAGAYSWAGVAANLSAQINLGQGTYAWTGVATNLGTQINLAAGAYSWSGISASLAAQINLGAGAYSWAGVAANLGTQINLGQGAYTWAGVALSMDGTIPLGIGAYAWGGVAVTLGTQTNLDVGSYSWAGVAASIPVVPVTPNLHKLFLDLDNGHLILRVN